MDCLRASFFNQACSASLTRMQIRIVRLFCEFANQFPVSELGHAVFNSLTVGQLLFLIERKDNGNENPIHQDCFRPAFRFSVLSAEMTFSKSSNCWKICSDVSSSQSTKTPSVLLKTKRYIANISIDFASDIDDSQRNLARPFAITYSTTRPKQLFVSCCNFYLKAAEHVFNNNFMGNAYWQHIGVSK